MVNINDTFGLLTVKKLDHISVGNRYSYGKSYKSVTRFWLCECKCGNTVVVNERNLITHNTSSCGCLRAEVKKKQARTALLNKTFKWVKVLELDHEEEYIAKTYKKTKYFWKCECLRCGKIFIANGADITSGSTTSCGCYKRDSISNGLHVTHNLSYHRLYRVHGGMIDRCYRSNSTSYDRYGARGIKICNEWYTPGVKGNPGLVNFINWAYANGYYDQPKDTPRKDILSIERLDINGDYTPDNCIWIPLYKQAENTSNNHKLYYNGDWCNIENLKSISPTPAFIQNALRHGWSDNAISYALMHQDLQIHKHNGKYYDKDGFSVLIPNYKN